MTTKHSLYSVLRRPLITEKAAIAGGLSNATVFEVHPDATKPQIKEAVEKVFDVKVRSVRTMNGLGKLKKGKGGKIGRQKSIKKAYVSLQAGHTLDVMEGL